MGEQLFTWTTLPNGGRRGAVIKSTKRGAPVKYKPGTLLLSVHMAPRLTPGTQTSLGAFSDLMSADGTSGWPDRLAGLKFRVETSSGQNPSRHVDVAVPAGVLEPALWTTLFSPNTLVRPFADEPPIDPVRVVSYRVAPVADLIKGQYKAVAKAPTLFYKRPSIDKLVSVSPALGAIAATNILKSFSSTAVPPVTKRIPPDSITKMRLKVKTSAAVASFDRFHQAFPTIFDADPELPVLDFHTAVSSLANYPALLRKLGLVIDIEIPETLVADMTRIRVVPLWPAGTTPSVGHGSGVTSEDKSPWTRFTLDWDRHALPFLPAPRVKAPQILDGEMIVRTPPLSKTAPISVLGFDVDMAAAKLKSLSQDALVSLNPLPVSGPNQRDEATTPAAANVAEFAPRATTSGLPTLRTIGPSLFLNNAQAVLKAALLRTSALNALLGNPDDGRAIVLDAEDVRQGWRIDVWDDNSRTWHQLCAREGEYRIGDSVLTWSGGAAKLVDEGWVEEGAVMEYGNAAKDKGTSDVKVHEQMFNWDGWSLVVSRPGKPILDGVDAEGHTRFPADDGTVTDGKGTYKVGQYVDPKFPLAASFGVPRGTLPMLRFGTAYRFRVRAVDLAGNSNPFKSTDNDFGRPGVTPAVVHRRYEPVPPPVNLPKTPMGPGESVNEIVLRSTDGGMAGPSERHVVPPRVAQTLAEQHGGFDKLVVKTVNGKKVTMASVDPAAYSVIKEHEGDLPVLGPASAIPSVPYLPEVIARGATFRGFPGLPPVPRRADKKAGSASPLVFSNTFISNGTGSVSLTVTRVAWEGVEWYDPKPFVLRVTGIEAIDIRVAKHAKPAAPSWDEATRTLTVQLPKAEKITVELSSYVDRASDLDHMAIVDLGRSGLSAKSAMRAEIDRTTAVGANWMVTPSQKLVLTHAVEKPLLVPDAIFYPNRDPGATWAGLTTNHTLKVHGKSTRRIEVIGRWTEYIDDPTRLESALAATYMVPEVGVEFEGFDTYSQWGGTQGTVAADTTNVKHGTSGVKMTATLATPAYAQKTSGFSVKLEASDFPLRLWVFCHDAPEIALPVIQLRLGINGTRKMVWNGARVTDLSQGWNCLLIESTIGTDLGEWTAYNGGSWNDTFDYIGLQVMTTNSSGSTASVTWDSLMKMGKGTAAGACICFDDGDVDVYTKQFPYMQSKGLLGTAYVVPTIIGESGKLTLEQLHEIYEAGWDVANHSYTHPPFDLGISPDVAVPEFTNCRDWLISNGFTRTPSCMTYPVATPTLAVREALVAAGMVLALHGKAHNFTEVLPFPDPAQIDSFGCSTSNSLARAKAQLDKAIRCGSVASFTFHNLDSEGQWTTAEFQEFIDYVVDSGVRCHRISDFETFNPSRDSSNSATPPVFEYPVEPRHVFSVDVELGDTSAINNIDSKRTRHHFGDTKRRKVKYHAVATSRFRDYFATSDADPATRFSVAGKEYESDIPASARPVAPVVAYCIPSFQHVDSSDTKQRLGGVRIYLERPWFSSGEGERLGVVFLEPTYLAGAWSNSTDFKAVRPWVSEWGHDPIWTSGVLPSDLVRSSSFPGATIDAGCILAENPSGPVVSVASFPVEFDNELNLWFADVRLNVGSAYMPFVRLSVCRWQPWAISWLNNSQVVMCDFIQQVPDRRFSVSYTPSSTSATVSLSGPTYASGSADKEGAALSARWAFAVVERRSGTRDFDWEAVPGNYEAQLTRPVPWYVAFPEGLIRGSIPLPTREAGYEYRIQVREYEHHSAAEHSQATASRLVFVDTLPLWGGARL